MERGRHRTRVAKVGGRGDDFYVAEQDAREGVARRADGVRICVESVVNVVFRREEAFGLSHFDFQVQPVSGKGGADRGGGVDAVVV